MHSTKQNRSGSRVAIFAALLALLVAGCTGSEPARESAASTSGDIAADLNAAAEWLGVDVPDSAQEFRFLSMDEGIDDSAVMRFDLPASEFEPFIAQLDIGDQLWAGRHGFPSFTNPAWMTPVN